MSDTDVCGTLRRVMAEIRKWDDLSEVRLTHVDYATRKSSFVLGCTCDMHFVREGLPDPFTQAELDAAADRLIAEWKASSIIYQKRAAGVPPPVMAPA